MLAFWAIFTLAPQQFADAIFKGKYTIIQKLKNGVKKLTKNAYIVAQNRFYGIIS